MSWTPAPRHCVVIRDGKLYIEGDDRALVLPWYLRVNNGRLQYDRSGGGEKHTPHDIEWGYYRVGFPDEPNKFWVRRCGNCRGLFVGPGVASYCGPCADVARNEAAARAKERAKEASAERSVQRQAKRTEAKCAACGKPIAGRQRGSGDRPAYCSSACRQWTYRRRKQTVVEPPF
jgi:hypothetical protein